MFDLKEIANTMRGSVTLAQLKEWMDREQVHVSCEYQGNRGSAPYHAEIKSPHKIGLTRLFEGKSDEFGKAIALAMEEYNSYCLLYRAQQILCNKIVLGRGRCRLGAGHQGTKCL